MYFSVIDVINNSIHLDVDGIQQHHIVIFAFLLFQKYRVISTVSVIY